MKTKNLLTTMALTLTLLLAGKVGWGQILTFDFASLAGNELSANSNFNDPNLNLSTITRGSGLTAATNSGRFNATNWALTSIDNAVSGNNFMEFTITPKDGNQFSVTSILIQLQRSNTGPSAIALRSSVDGYTSNLDQIYNIVDNTNTQSFTFNFTQSNTINPVTYRIYMYAEATSGSGGPGDGTGDDIVVNGTVTFSPLIINSESSLTGFSYLENSGPSAEQSFTVEGSNLTDNITVTPPANYEISLTSGSGFASDPIVLNQSGGSVSSTPVYVRLKAGLAVGSYNEDITLTSTNALPKSVSCSGTVYLPEPTNHVTGFAATVDGNSQITLNWTDATGGTEPTGYIIMVNTTGTFTDPVDGTPVADDTDMSDDAGKVNVAQGTQTYVWTGLTPNTTYYFKIYPYTNSGTLIDYKTDGTVPTDNKTTTNILPEPSNHATNFLVSGVVKSNEVTLTWTDAVGAQLPEGYVILINTSGLFTDPTDGTPIANDTDFADDAGAVNVAYGVQTYTFNTLLPGKTYYARIYPYTNSGTAINYKTDGTVPEVTFGTPMILVTSPNGNETFYAGDNLNITWTSANMDTETIKCEAYVRQGLTTTWAWEELAPALPNTGSLSFTIPTETKYGTQYKIRLTGNTSGVSDESDAPFTVIATPSIYDIQSHNTAGASDWSGDKVRFSGIVTAQYSTTTRFFVQDSAKGWNGIYVFNSPVSPAIGDSVVVEGTVTEYNGLTEISPTTSTTVVASGKPLPTPIDLTTLAVNDEQYESVLVKVTGAICLSGSSGNFTVNDGSGNLVVYKSLFSGLTLNINRKYDITGVVGWYSPNYQLYPRNAADIYLYNNVATLSDLQVDGATVTGFDPATLTYNVELPYGTTTVPTVTYTLTDAKASAVKNDAAALPGATTVAVTAEDGLVSQTYTINFTIAAPNTEANILTYTVAGVNATIDNVNHTITATVPYSTDITNLVATFTLSDGATAKVGGVDQISGTTANDFTNPVTYTVTAQDGTTTQDWTVTITKAAEPNHEANITAYSINGVDGIINDGAHTISVTLPYGTDVTALVATFTLSTNATAKVGGVDQVSGTTANDFTNPVTYTVTAEDGIITQDWTVTVIVTPASTAKDIVSFTLGGELSSVIDANAATVTIVMPYGTDVTNLTPVISISEFATINPASGVAQDFTNPVVYTVTAQDNSTKTWTVTVSVAKNTEANILTYSINSVDGTIDNVNHTVAITLPYGTDVTNLVATFTLSGGASAKVGGVDQVSGVTANNFTNPVTYTVTADDGTTTQVWTVTVTVAQPALTTLVAWTFPNNPDDAIADEGIAENLSRTITCTASGTVAYNVTGVTTYAATNTGWDNGVDTKFWMVEFTTLGYENIKVSSAQRSSSTGPRDFKLQYQVNNSGNWIDVQGATNIVVASDFVSGVVDNVSLPSECDNQNLISLRWVVTSTTSVANATVASTGTNRIDNIYVKGEVFALSNDATVSSLVYTVDNVAGTITNVPQTETLDNFKANITPAAGASFDVYQTDGTTVATDLQTGYKLICTAEDGVTKKTYTITLNTTLSSENAILSYSINGVNGTIDAVNHTVTLTLPYGTNVTNLVATFTLSAAATAKVGTTPQVSGTTANDFTSPVTYTVTAEDGSTQDWVVTVNITAASTEKDILTFTIAGQVSSTIDAAAGTVTVVMPYGTNITSLTPTITVSQYATINPASGVAQDFTNPVTYTVTAQDNSTKTWTVTVTVQDVPLTKIYSIQYTTDASGDSPLKGQQVRTKGIVTAVKTGTSSFNIWLQDSAKAWNAVYVYGVNNSFGTIAQGDSVELVGTVDEYNNLTEIKTVNYLNKINSGNTLPTPVDVTPAQAASEAYEGVLVKLSNVECTVADAGFGEFTVSDGTNNINIDDFLYKFTPTQGARYNITGVVDYSFSAFKVLPRNASDVESAQVKYTVTFTVKRSDGTTPVDGATINVTGQGNVTTDASGVATMQLPDGNYTYTVVKSGFDTKNGNFTVSGANINVDITLIQTGVPTNPIAKLSVYPNPFTDRIYFTGAEVTRVTITSVIGQVVMDRQVENTESIDVSSIERGIYLVRFYNSNGESVLRKLVKE
ncbi:MAG: DUF5018 domain-containing protein [Bacteroidota bacterium]